MLSELKYWLLTLLLDDICSRVDRCSDCICACPVQIQIGDETIDGHGCEHQNIKYQAAKVWRAKKHASKK